MRCEVLPPAWSTETTTTINFSFIKTALKVLFFNDKGHQNETFGYKWKICYISFSNAQQYILENNIPENNDIEKSFIHSFPFVIVFPVLNLNIRLIQLIREKSGIYYLLSMNYATDVRVNRWPWKA